MSDTTFQVGDDVKCTAEFQTADDAAVDPDTVRFKVKNPSGTVTTLAYGTDAAVIRDSTGNYHVIVDANQAGTWHYRFWSTGNGKAADESTFEVEESDF